MICTKTGHRIATRLAEKLECYDRSDKLMNILTILRKLEKLSAEEGLYGNADEKVWTTKGSELDGLVVMMRVNISKSHLSGAKHEVGLEPVRGLRVCALA